MRLKVTRDVSKIIVPWTYCEHNLVLFYWLMLAHMEKVRQRQQPYMQQKLHFSDQNCPMCVDRRVGKLSLKFTLESSSYPLPMYVSLES